jgi:hypothetical protein
MGKLIRVALAAGLIAALLPSSAVAAENIIKFFERNQDVFITQGEWAVVLVKAIGKDSETPTSASMVDYIALLEKNRIQPIGGWNSGQYLAYGQKAVTMVQALGLEDQLPAEAKEMDYIWLLEGLGFHEGQPAELVRQSDALQRNINDPIFQEVAGNEFNINISVFAPPVQSTSH